MGLELVEVILEIEDHFGITLADEEVSRCHNVGELIGLVTMYAMRQETDVCQSSRAFYRFRRSLLAQLGLARRDIRPSSRLEELIPWKLRRGIWRRLQAAGLELPDLILTPFVFYLTALIVMLPFTLVAAWQRVWWPLPGIIPAAYLAWHVTRPLATCAPASFKTAGGAALCLAAKQPDPANLTRAEVASRVRWIIADQLCVPVEKLTADTKWDDLD